MKMISQFSNKTEGIATMFAGRHAEGKKYNPSEVTEGTRSTASVFIVPSRFAGTDPDPFRASLFFKERPAYPDRKPVYLKVDAGVHDQ